MPHTFACRRWVVVICTAWISALGCTTPLFRGQSADNKDVTDLVDDEPGARLVGALASPMGMDYLKVESAALVTQLDGTGSDPPPSPMRDELRKEMLTHNVRSPDEALASKDTAMVMISGLIPPAARKGDVLDVDVRIAHRTETTSLRGGWLMAARMRQLAMIENSLRTGHVAALADGPILCDSIFDKSQDSALETRGRVLGGAVVQLDRDLGLLIRAEHSSIKTSAMIGAAINERFHDFDRGTKRGLANPTRDNYIELKVHSRYRDDVMRYIQVVRHIAVGESPVERLVRVSELEKQLLEPTSSQRSALQLEAIGKEGIASLRKGLACQDAQVRFYAAESLAYLDDGDATDVLFEVARNERAFRWRAMLALAVMDQFASQDALLELLNSSSAETRYGAFRALRVCNPHDMFVRGEVLNDQFAFHALNNSGEPLIHVSRSKRPEIVVFGPPQKLAVPSFVFAGKQIIVKRHGEQTIKVLRYSAAGEDQDQHEICSTDLGDVVRTIAKLGGNYTDVIQAIDEAKSKGYLAARVEVDALPRRGRPYHRTEQTAQGDEPDTGYEAPESIPDLFLDQLKREGNTDGKPGASDFDITEPKSPNRGWFNRMTSWMQQ